MDKTAEFSLLCWNIGGKKNHSIVQEYLCKQNADICFLQEVPISQVKKEGALRSQLESRGYEIFYLQEKGSKLPCNCIIYKTCSFQVYTVLTASKESVQCALDEVTIDQQSWKDNQSDEYIKSLKEFAENHSDKRVCVALLQCKSLPRQPIIVASCHMKTKTSDETEKNKKVKYIEEILKYLHKLSNDIKCPVIVAGDFNRDVLQEIDYKKFLLEVPKYDPTIRRVICSGGSHDKCIDYFANTPHMFTITDVRADIALSPDNYDMFNWDQRYFPQYQKHLLGESTLDNIPFDHDPLNAKLIINVDDLISIEKDNLSIPITYCDLKKKENLAIIVKHFAKLDPLPELCIFQNTISSELNIALNNVEINKYTYVSCMESPCVVAYNAHLLQSHNKEDDNPAVFTFRCHRIINKPTFKLVILHNAGLNQKKNAEEQFAKFSTEEFPVLLVGGFYVDLYRLELCKNENIRHGFEVPNYSPTVFRMTHTYNRKCLYICCDFFTIKNHTGGSTVLSIDDVHADTINPPQDLIRGPYNVNYDLIRNETDEVLETLSATLSIVHLSSPSSSTSNTATSDMKLESATPLDSDSTPKKSKDELKTAKSKKGDSK